MPEHYLLDCIIFQSNTLHENFRSSPSKVFRQLLAVNEAPVDRCSYPTHVCMKSGTSTVRGTVLGRIQCYSYQHGGRELIETRGFDSTGERVVLRMWVVPERGRTKWRDLANF